MPKIPPWSFSSMKTFEQCPKKYYHLKVAKDVKDEGGEAALYGSMVHEAAERFFTHDEPIPNKFGYMKPVVDRLAAIEGEKHPEVKLAVLRDGDEFFPTDFDDPDAYYRGIADLVVVNKNRAWCIDYKTGKNPRYADLRQLDLMAGALFLKFPEVNRIKSALLFVVTEDIVPKDHHRKHIDRYLTVFDRKVQQLEVCMENDSWSPNEGPLCAWCPVTSCPHWRKRSR